MENFSRPQQGILRRAIALSGGFPITESQVLTLPESGKLHFWAVDQIRSVIIVREDAHRFTGIKMRPGSLEAAVREYRRQVDRQIN